MYPEKRKEKLPENHIRLIDIRKPFFRREYGNRHIQTNAGLRTGYEAKLL